MHNINEERLKTILQDREELAPAMPEGHTIESIQLHNQDGIVASMPIEIWYAFTREMRRRINCGEKPNAADYFIAQIISDVCWVEYISKDEAGLTRLIVPTWSI